MFQSVKKLIFKDPFLFSAIVAFIFFILLTFSFSFTYSTDDYSYLARSHSTIGLSFESFGGYVSRLPVWALFTWIGFSTHFYDHYHLAMSLWFLIFSLSFSFLVKEIFLILKISEFSETDKFLIPIVLIPFILYPTHHEVLYWATDFAYVIGLTFLTFGLRSKQFAVKVLFLTLSFLTSEMYVFPLFSILFIDTFINNKKYQNLILFFITAIIYFAIRKSLIPIYGDYSVGSKLTFEVKTIVKNIYATIVMNFGMHFYKTIWILTIPYLLLIALPIFNFLKEYYNDSKLKFWAILLSIPGSFCFYWLISYGASRALFGSQNFNNALVIVSLFLFLRSNIINSKLKYLIPTIIFLIFIGFSLRTFSIKNQNYEVINQAKTEIQKELAICEYKCIDAIAYKDLPLQKDWVMHPDYWKYFIKWIKLSP